ncbi:hypothetical protein [Streptomyces sp. NPDC002994]|uniref:hypothetical protein n=1 Tax=Streptomyces sp. NPDC002994 TaxID=3154441 RepID=UPI0033B9BEE3
MTDQLPRRFTLVRNIDETGVSGTGVIVEGLEFTDGTVALRWLTGTTSTAIYASMRDVETIHGHGGKTRIVWIDDQLAAGLKSLLEGKNAELKRHHLDARIGNLQGSRVQAVREVLAQWAPEAGTPLAALWQQVRDATELYTAQIEAINTEAARDIPGITGGTDA